MSYITQVTLGCAVYKPWASLKVSFEIELDQLNFIMVSELPFRCWAYFSQLLSTCFVIMLHVREHIKKIGSLDTIWQTSPTKPSLVCTREINKTSCCIVDNGELQNYVQTSGKKHHNWNCQDVRINIV